ncbi:tetratricopeptide repeat protein [Microcoleus sp. FACHB-53]|nr:tetratricopeptide repeat protein [Microcoleus sp. FACHB-53]
MKYQRFIEQLANFYDNWGKDSVYPKSNQFEPIIKQVKGITSANVMQLLNFAVGCLEAKEVYCEVGCFQGASLIGALLEHPERMAYAVDTFSHFNSLEDSFDKLIENIYNFDLEEQVIFCNQEVEDFFFEFKSSKIEEKIGLYFYNGAQDYRSRLMGLLLVKPFLASQSIIVLSQCHWEACYQASLDFIASHPQSRLVLDFSKDQSNTSIGWNGLQVISWDVNANHTMDWSSFQEFRKPALISSISQLHINSRQKVVDSWYREAIELYFSGKPEKAEQKYKQILSCDMSQAEAWYNLGKIYYQTQRYQDALESLLRALELDSSKAIWHYDLGVVLEKIGALPQAIRAYQESLVIDPQWISAYNSLGNIWFESGELEQAESMYRQVLSACPDHCAGYINLGNILMAKHHVEEAIEAYEKALSLKPRDPDILHNLGVAFEAKNDQAEAYSYFGYSFYRQGNYKQAINYYQKFLETKTGDVAFYVALADCYKALNHYTEAINIYREAIRLYPKAGWLYLNLGLGFQDFGDTEKSIAVLTEALQELPDNLTLQIYQQLMLPIIYENPEEIEIYRQRFTQGLSALVQQTRLDTPEEINNALMGISSRTNFYLQYQGKNDLNLQRQYGEFVHRVMAANYPSWSKSLPLLPINEGEKIRVGYISNNFKNQTVGKLMFGWVKHHNQQDFEVHCYYTGRKVDQMTRKFQLYSHAFHHLPDDLDAVCQKIVADQLHILVFPDIGMDTNTNQIAGLRLAAIQCVSWGHPITTGLPTIDYYISSDLMEPNNAQEHYSERLVCLPNIGICYEKPNLPEVTKSRSDFQLRDDTTVYLSCQSLFKYLPQYDYIFPAIAQQVPQAQFAFLSHHLSLPITEKFRKRLKQAFARFSLNSDDYCVIVPRQDWVGYASLNLVSDIYLDTLSWSGGNTTLEAIACNLPIVTCPGEFMRGRHSYGILRQLGVTETIAKTEAEYIDIAVRLGLDSTWRESLVQRMIEHHGNLYDDKTCVEALEAFYRRVVQEVQSATTAIENKIVGQ